MVVVFPGKVNAMERKRDKGLEVFAGGDGHWDLHNRIMTGGD